MRIFTANGGHRETKGLSPIGNVTTVPLHQHHVHLNVRRIDFSVKYQFSRAWTLGVNIPYEEKSQQSEIEIIEVVTPAEYAAMLRNMQIHHRNETYRGIADVDCFLGRSFQSLLRINDLLTVGLGSTLPLGKTEENPWELGKKGLKHLHIQFGTGTFNPIVNLHYGLPLYKGISASADIQGIFPFYENSKTFLGSKVFSTTVGFNACVTNWLSFQTKILNIYQSYAYWAGKRDINTGIEMGMVLLGASVRSINNIPVSITLMLPLRHRTLYNDSNTYTDNRSDENDSFEVGPLVLLSAFYSF